MIFFWLGGLIIAILFLAASSFMPNKPGTLLVELGPEDKEYQAVDEEVNFADLFWKLYIFFIHVLCTDIQILILF